MKYKVKKIKTKHFEMFMSKLQLSQSVTGLEQPKYFEQFNILKTINLQKRNICKIGLYVNTKVSTMKARYKKIMLFIWS